MFLSFVSGEFHLSAFLLHKSEKFTIMLIMQRIERKALLVQFRRIILELDIHSTLAGGAFLTSVMFVK